MAFIKISIRELVLYVYGKKPQIAGTTARCAASLVGVNFKTAIYYFHRLRKIITYHLSAENDKVVDGEIEVDESYFGGKRKGKRGRAAAGKVSVFGIFLHKTSLKAPDYSNYLVCINSHGWILIRLK